MTFLLVMMRMHLFECGNVGDVGNVEMGQNLEWDTCFSFNRQALSPSFVNESEISTVFRSSIMGKRNILLRSAGN